MATRVFTFWTNVSDPTDPTVQTVFVTPTKRGRIVGVKFCGTCRAAAAGDEFHSQISLSPNANAEEHDAPKDSVIAEDSAIAGAAGVINNASNIIGMDVPVEASQRIYGHFYVPANPTAVRGRALVYFKE